MRASTNQIALSERVLSFPRVLGSTLPFGKAERADLRSIARIVASSSTEGFSRPTIESPQPSHPWTGVAGTCSARRVAISPARVQLAGERESRRHVHGPDLPERARLAPTLSRFEVTPHD